MNLQIAGLIFVVILFSCLFTWAFWPGNRRRFQANAESILDTEPSSNTRENQHEH